MFKNFLQKRGNFFILALGVGITLTTLSLSAQEVSAQESSAQESSGAGTVIDPELVGSDRVIYDPAFFDQYAPLTAADMVSQIPGFSLASQGQRGDGGGRGFSQGQGNLLINGKRPSTKSSSPTEILRRIPAEYVVQIIILRQGSPELAGQSGLIVDVITNGEEGLSGTFEVQGILRETVARPHASFSLGVKKGNFTFTTELLWDTSNRNWRDKGPETVVDADGVLLEIRDEHRNVTFKRPTLNLGLAWDGENNQVANLNFKGFYSKFTMRETSRQFIPTATSSVVNGDFGDFQRTIINPFLSERYSYEIGGDYARPFGGGTLKLIGLRSFEDIRDSRETIDEAADGMVTGFRSTTDEIESETILRILYTFEPDKGQTLEWAVEGALNTLETTAVFSEDLGDGFVPVIVEGSDVRVEEERGETSLLYIRPLGSKFKLQTTLAVEYSKLSVKGPNGNSRSFVRPKGFVALTYDPSGNTQIRSRIDRLVGQLNFGNFASSVDFQEGNENSGNTELVPQQSWQYEFTVEHRFGAKNVVTLTFLHETIEDFITFIKLGNGDEGLGNLKDTTQIRQSISLDTTWSTNAIGLKGGKLDVRGKIFNTKLTDPLTGQVRDFDRTRQWQYFIRFRQDIEATPWAWGWSLFSQSRAARHRTDQRTLETVRPFNDATIFIEHKNIFGMTGNFQIENVFGPERVTTREFFDGDRLGEIIQTERRVRNTGVVYRMGLSGKF